MKTYLEFSQLHAWADGGSRCNSHLRFSSKSAQPRSQSLRLWDAVLDQRSRFHEAQRLQALTTQALVPLRTQAVRLQAQHLVRARLLRTQRFRPVRFRLRRPAKIQPVRSSMPAFRVSLDGKRVVDVAMLAVSDRAPTIT